MAYTLEELLQSMVASGASDLHLTAGSAPRLRVHGALRPIDDGGPLSPDESQKLVYSVLTNEQVAAFERDLELDFSFGIPKLGRFRVNVFRQRGAVGAVLRAIPYDIMPVSKLGLPQDIIERLCKLPKGLILVTGATGAGKSTTLASMLNYVNNTREAHIVTVEDPIEFLHNNKRCLFNQREVGTDTHQFAKALKSVFRQDPDVILIGEMRDLETIEAALHLSETGHLTFGTLHTSESVQTINRIVDVFPSHQQQQIRTLLSFTLHAVICQQLLPRADGTGLVLAAEIMIVNAAIRSLVRDDKAHQIYSILQTGAQHGMRTMNQALAQLCQAGVVTREEIMSRTTDLDDLVHTLERTGAAGGYRAARVARAGRAR